MCYDDIDHYYIRKKNLFFNMQNINQKITRVKYKDKILNITYEKTFIDYKLDN